MPLPSGELDRTTIVGIFGPDMDETMGNQVLRLVNYRRMSGSLIDVGVTFPPELAISEQTAVQALRYLRQEYPDFDEQEAGAAWAESEIAKAEQEYMDRAEDLGLYKREKSDAALQPQGTDYGRSRYGDSALAALRRENKARWMEEDRKKKEAEERAESERIAQLRARGEDEGAAVESPGQLSELQSTTGRRTSDGMSLREPVAKAWLQPVVRKGWVKYYEQQATIVKENRVPQLSILRRLGPAALLALGALGACVVLHEMYAPPPKSARMFPDVPPAVATLGAITAINLAVFFAWRMPFLWRTMNKYFLITPGYPNVMGVVGAQFSHQTVKHLFANMILMWPFGLMLHEDVGRGTFLAIYLGTGVVGAYGSLVYNVIRQRWLYYIFGSSTAVYGTVAATCLLRADQDVKIMGYQLPLTGMTMLGVLGGLEILAAWKGPSLTTDYAGHFTSLTAGVLAAWYVRRQAAAKQMTRMESVPLQDTIQAEQATSSR
ncbi:hypothetical protein MBLNU459_g1418t1 [Dothideomycetes sp. NU459]